MNWLCRFGIHKWSKWKDITINEVKYGKHPGQQRYCQWCNKAQARYVFPKSN